MSRPLTAVLIALALLVAALLPATGEARVNIRVGIGDQNVAMFDHPDFRDLRVKRVRYFIPWNVMNDREQRLRAREFVKRARQDRISVFVHPSTDDLRPRRADLPSPREFRRHMNRFVRYFRSLGVRDFGVFNEANHVSQPTYRSPRRAAQYFKVMYRAVKRRCRSCAVVALDVLDQRGVERYMQRFYRALSPTWRRRASIVGIHNYGDVNRRRTRFTRNIIRTARRYNRRTQFWFTETGGLVRFEASDNAFPCSERRAARRLRDMFRLARRFRRQGVRRVYIYNWTGAGCDKRFDAGLTDENGNTRDGYDVVRRALRDFLR